MLSTIEYRQVSCSVPAASVERMSPSRSSQWSLVTHRFNNISATFLPQSGECGVSAPILFRDETSESSSCECFRLLVSLYLKYSDLWLVRMGPWSWMAVLATVAWVRLHNIESTKAASSKLQVASLQMCMSTRSGFLPAD
jgi:hypothetical protein